MSRQKYKFFKSVLFDLSIINILCHNHTNVTLSVIETFKYWRIKYKSSECVSIKNKQSSSSVTPLSSHFLIAITIKQKQNMTGNNNRSRLDLFKEKLNTLGCGLGCVVH